MVCTLSLVPCDNSRAGSIGGMTRQEIEAGQGEQENFGKQKDSNKEEQMDDGREGLLGT